ncbi:MAG: hypothetical protein JEZ04_11525 [Spirochaetales bacterium]|nr:hypothetical protein [Spirochaetales bacterium]
MLCSPVVYEHAARFIGRSPYEVSQSAKLLSDAHIAAWRYYKHSPVTIGIDIYNLEAEAFGSKVDIPEGNEVPGISGSIIGSLDELLTLRPLSLNESGRYPLHIEAARRVRAELPEADVRLPLSGPFSIASNLLGFEKLLMASIMEQDKTRAVLEHITGLQIELARQIVESGFEVSFFESAAAPPLLSPELIEAIEIPVLKKMMAALTAMNGKKNAFIMGGDNASIAGSLAGMGAGFLICPAETDQRIFLENASADNLLIRINMSAEIIASADKNEIQNEINRVKELMNDFPSTLAGTGVLSYDSDPELVSWITGQF